MATGHYSYIKHIANQCADLFASLGIAGLRLGHGRPVGHGVRQCLSAANDRRREGELREAGEGGDRLGGVPVIAGIRVIEHGQHAWWRPPLFLARLLRPVDQLGDVRKRLHIDGTRLHRHDQEVGAIHRNAQRLAVLAAGIDQGVIERRRQSVELRL
jgi:hypothetical protein